MRRRTRKTTLEIGTVSTATLRAEDLIPSLLWDLERIRVSKAERKTLRDVRRRSDAADADSEYWTGNESADDLDELVQIADNHVPDYCYYGSLDGDGAHFGVWPSLDRLDEDGYGSHPEVARSRKDVDARDVAKETGAAYALDVNDHGNSTLYRRAGRRWIEVWSVV